MPGLLVLERMLALFVLAQGLHIARWRWCGPPSGYLFWFLKAWLIAPGCAIAVWLAGWALLSQSADWNDALVWLGAFIGYGALCGAYVMIYPAISDLSPSLELVRALARMPGAIMAIKSIEIPGVAGVDSVAHRVANLRSSGLVVLQNGNLEMTGKGRRIGSLLDIYRRLLGIRPQAGG